MRLIGTARRNTLKLYLSGKSIDGLFLLIWQSIQTRTLINLSQIRMRRNQSYLKAKIFAEDTFAEFIFAILHRFVKKPIVKLNSRNFSDKNQSSKQIPRIFPDKNQAKINHGKRSLFARL